MDHYHCVLCYFPRTRTSRVCNTVPFLPHKIPFPEVSLKDHLHQAAEDLVTILTKPPSPLVPSLREGDLVRNALLDIATQLRRVDQVNEPMEDTQQTRVPQEVAQDLRVQTSETPRMEDFQQCSMTPQRFRLQKEPTHEYNLRLQKHLHWNNQHSYRHHATQQLAALSVFQLVAHHIYQPNSKKETIDTLLQGSNRLLWLQSLSNERGRLAQGNDKGVLATSTIYFVTQQEVPQGQDITYATFVIDYRLLKSEPHRVRITVGGDRLTYANDAGSPAANMLETKVLVNSTISDAKQGARFMSADLKDFFLATPMEGEEYMKANYKHFPKDIRKQYDLENKVSSSGHIYIKIKKGMYGLKQAAILAYENLKQNLAQDRYKPVGGTVGMWQHKTHPTKCCVCVDDFGIKYFSKDNTQHLLTSFKKDYKVTTDWDGQKYCGLTFNWQYKLGYVDFSMPGYVYVSLKQLGHTPKRFPRYSLHAHQPI